MAGCYWLLLMQQPAAAGADWRWVEMAAGWGWLGLLAAGCCKIKKRITAELPRYTRMLIFL
jgi:hypothetical protein